MACYIEHILSSQAAQRDLKELVAEPSLRRRMSRVLKLGVGTAIESLGGVEHIDRLDGIITATGWGCLADSERFLRTMIQSDEQLLNPTPFIQSTFNTVGGLLALLRHNHAYNMTYAGLDHPFESALLDGWLRIVDGAGERILVGGFDELTPTLDVLQRRAGLYRRYRAGEGALFVTLTAHRTAASVARLERVELLTERMTNDAICAQYGVDEVITFAGDAWYPTRSAELLPAGVARLNERVKRVALYEEGLRQGATIVILEWLG